MDYMNRRKAIRNIAIVSTGIVLLPACEMESLPVYENLALEPQQLDLIDWLTNAILPKEGLEISTPESTSDFVLTMLNDCYAPEDIRQYLAGSKIFVQYVKDEYGISYKKLNPEQSILLFSEIMKSGLLPESLKFFLATTKQLTVRHFTSSEYFMKNHLDFEFAPGRYLGCVRV